MSDAENDDSRNCRETAGRSAAGRSDCRAAFVEHCGPLNLVAAGHADRARQLARDVGADAAPREIEARAPLLFDVALTKASAAVLNTRGSRIRADRSRYSNGGRALLRVKATLREEVHRPVLAEDVAAADLEEGARREVELLGRHAAVLPARRSRGRPRRRRRSRPSSAALPRSSPADRASSRRRGAAR